VKKRGDQETYEVHRAVGAKVLAELNAKARTKEELFKVAFELVRYRLPRPSMDSPEPHKWNQFKDNLPHVASLQRIYADPLSVVPLTPFLGLAELFRDGGVLLWQRYISNDAMKLLNTAEKILDSLEGDNDHIRAEIHITINLLLQYMGISHRKESKERLAKILEFRKKMIEKQDSDKVTVADRTLLINAYADYANSMLQFNNYQDAEPIYQGCHERFLKLGPEESNPFAFAKLYHHMAYCRMYRRDFDEAIKLARRSISIIEALYGDKQLSLRYQFDLACIMLQKGDKEEALRLHNAILTERVNLVGRASYFTLQSQYAVGALYSYLGRLDEAEYVPSS
jgi:tetratricopeptide (TPR) repeat protein